MKVQSIVLPAWSFTENPLATDIIWCPHNGSRAKGKHNKQQLAEMAGYSSFLHKRRSIWERNKYSTTIYCLIRWIQSEQIFELQSLSKPQKTNVFEKVDVTLPNGHYTMRQMRQRAALNIKILSVGCASADKDSVLVKPNHTKGGTSQTVSNGKEKCIKENGNL